MVGVKRMLERLDRSYSGGNGPHDQEAGKNRWVRRSEAPVVPQAGLESSVFFRVSHDV